MESFKLISFILNNCYCRYFQMISFIVKVTINSLHFSFFRIVRNSLHCFGTAYWTRRILNRNCFDSLLFNVAENREHLRHPTSLYPLLLLTLTPPPISLLVWMALIQNPFFAGLNFARCCVMKPMNHPNQTSMGSRAYYVCRICFS